MNDTDELFRHVRQSFDQIRLPRSADEITTQARSTRRRTVGVRLATTALTAAALATTLAVSLSQGATQQTQAAPGGQGGAETHVHLAAWSVDSGPQDTVTVTVRTLNDPDELTTALAGAGVRAKVHFFAPGQHADCIDQSASLPQLAKVISTQPMLRPDGTTVLAIKRNAMPAASVLHFVIFKYGNGGGSASASSVWLLDGGTDACVPATAPVGGPTPDPETS